MRYCNYYAMLKIVPDILYEIYRVVQSGPAKLRQRVSLKNLRKKCNINFFEKMAPCRMAAIEKSYLGNIQTAITYLIISKFFLVKAQLEDIARTFNNIFSFSKSAQ